MCGLDGALSCHFLSQPGPLAAVSTATRAFNPDHGSAPKRAVAPPYADLWMRRGATRLKRVPSLSRHEEAAARLTGVR